MTTANASTTLSSILLAAAAVTLGLALQVSNGTLHPLAVALTSTALVAALAALVARERRSTPSSAPGGATLVLTVGLAVGLTLHLLTPPGIYLQLTHDALRAHHTCIALAALLMGVVFVDPRGLRPLHIPAVLGVFFALGLWLLRASPRPHIDVWVWHNEAYAALAHGDNPYAITMPNIYGRTEWFAPGLADARRVFVGYPYPPLTLLLGGLGHLSLGDYRYANLLAMVVAGAFIAFMRRGGKVATLAAMVFLFTPRGLFVLEQGWTEALSAMALTAVVFCACRAPRLLPYAFGVMLATKQYFVFAIPLAPLLLGRSDGASLRRLFLPAGAVAVLVTAPFVFWNPASFIESVVTFQAKQPFRPDSLSMLAYTAKDGVARLPLGLGFLVCAAVILFGLRRAPRTPQGFAATFSVAMLAFFFFGKQAFTNYYFLVIAGLCCAIAATPNEGRTTQAATSAEPE